MKRTATAALVAAALATSLTGCGSDSASSSSSSKTTLTVFAASSLTDAFGTLATSFEKDHPDVKVVSSFDSSSTLATQITQGAPADVLATADRSSMQIVVDAGNNGATPVPFAANTMAIVTPADNPAGIKSIDDLAGTKFVVCDPAAPCGAVAADILHKAGITASPASLEDKVTSVLAKVTLGEADAGMVYVTDAQGAGDSVDTIDIPAALNEVTPYYIAPVKGSANADLAQQWIDLVSSQAGQGVLKADGFLPP